MSTLVKTDALGGDPTFAPVRKLAAELLAEIFLLSISILPEPVNSEGLDGPPRFVYGMYLQAARAQLARVCRWWNTVLNNDPRVWATVVLDNRRPIAPEIVTLWIKRSKSRPLDVYIKLGKLGFECHCDLEDIRPMVAMIHTHLWRIRSLIWSTCCRRHLHLSTLLPPGVSTTYTPMMQNLCLLGFGSDWSSSLGNIHCPDLRTLTIENCGEAIKSLTSKPMPNMRHLHLHSDGPVTLYIKLLSVLPDLVSLKWIHRHESTVEVPNSRVVLQSLKSLTLVEITPHFLAYFFAPSLEFLKLAGDATKSIHVLQIIQQDWKVTLRHLTLTGNLPEERRIRAMLPYLTHLETLIVCPNEDTFFNELLMALIPDNCDFALAYPCPQLKTMEIHGGLVNMSALVGFVWRRVKADWDGPEPGLVTSLKLSRIPVAREVCEQLVKSHGSSVQIRLDLSSPYLVY